MIAADGQCYRAKDDGSVVIAEEDMGVPFASVCNFKGNTSFDIGEIKCIEDLKTLLTIKIEEQFGLNSMHVVRIDGQFDEVQARSEEAYNAIHVSLKDMLQITQKSFQFNDLAEHWSAFIIPTLWTVSTQQAGISTLFPMTGRRAVMYSS